MSYTDNYERGINGIIIFWIRNHYDHARFFDREISHHEIELARANQSMIQLLGNLLRKAETKNVDCRTLIEEVQQATQKWHNFLSQAMARAIRCELIISTPTALLDHMIREAEESILVLGLIQTGGQVSPADASIHESYFWLRQMSDHLVFINHYLDASNYELRDVVKKMTKKFNNLFLQANALRTMIPAPRMEVLPVLLNFNQMVIAEAKALEAFKLELSEIIKHCAAVTTAPPDLLEHIAREAHHLWRNLEEMVIS
jgi:hypothetical protein